MPKNKRLTFRLDDDLDQAIIKRCESLGCTKSEYLESLARAEIEDISSEPKNQELRKGRLVSVPDRKARLVYITDKGEEIPYATAINGKDTAKSMFPNGVRPGYDEAKVEVDADGKQRNWYRYGKIWYSPSD